MDAEFVIRWVEGNGRFPCLWKATCSEDVAVILWVQHQWQFNTGRTQKLNIWQDLEVKHDVRRYYCWTNEDLFWVKMLCEMFRNSIFANAGVGKNVAYFP